MTEDWSGIRERIRMLWPLRHGDRRSELRTLIAAYRQLVG